MMLISIKQIYREKSRREARKAKKELLKEGYLEMAEESKQVTKEWATADNLK